MQPNNSKKSTAKAGIIPFVYVGDFECKGTGASQVMIETDSTTHFSLQAYTDYNRHYYYNVSSISVSVSTQNHGHFAECATANDCSRPIYYLVLVCLLYNAYLAMACTKSLYPLNIGKIARSHI